MHRYMSNPVTAFRAREGRKSTMAILASMKRQKNTEAMYLAAGLKRSSRYW